MDDNAECEMIEKQRRDSITLSDLHMIDMSTDISKQYSPIKKENNEHSIYYIFSEKALTILTHVLIMVSFELYFYFEYITLIERKLFLEKIDEYFDQINEKYDNYDREYKDSINYIVLHENTNYNVLYDNYQDALKDQRHLLKHLKYISLGMFTISLILFMIAFINALIYRLHIHWKHIALENIFMFMLLGIFEYLFFTYVILLYTPITDEELEYRAYKNMYNIINGTYS
jgi:hypothetical protein